MLLLGGLKILVKKSERVLHELLVRFPPLWGRAFFWAVGVVPRLYHRKPLHDGCNKEKIGQLSGNRYRPSLAGKKIENVYTARATYSLLAPGASGRDAGGKAIFLPLLMVQRE